MTTLTDEELARRIQDEEIASYTNQTGLNEAEAAQINPLLRRARSRTVQRNVISDLSEARDSSLRLLIIYFVWAIAEMTTSAVILYQQWNKECDRPLKWWLLGFSGRYVVLLPLSVALYRARNTPDVDSLNKVKSWATFGVFIWFIVGQTWIYTLQSCQQTARPLYLLCLILMILFYAALACPLLIVIGVCLFLPCVLIFHRYFGPRAGAPETTIQKLPTRVHPGQVPQPVPSISDDEKDNEEICSICMEAYKKGDKLKQLPCKHEFHDSCIDRWLNLKNACPLCRAPIGSGGRSSSTTTELNAGDERHPFANMV